MIRAGGNAARFRFGAQMKTQSHTAGEMITERAGRAQELLVRITLGISLLVPILFSDEALKQSELAWNFSRTVNTLVPAIGHMATVSSHPMLTATVASLNWLFFPLYLGLFIAAHPFWNDQFVAGVNARVKASSRIMRIAGPLFLVFYLLMDWGVIPHGVGMWSMNGAWWFLKVGGLGIFDQYRYGIALFYWAGCVFQMLTYGAATYLVGLSLRRLVRHLHAQAS